MKLNWHLEFISLHFLYTLKEPQVMSRKLHNCLIVKQWSGHKSSNPLASLGPIAWGNFQLWGSLFWPQVLAFNLPCSRIYSGSRSPWIQLCPAKGTEKGKGTDRPGFKFWSCLFGDPQFLHLSNGRDNSQSTNLLALVEDHIGQGIETAFVDQTKTECSLHFSRLHPWRAGPAEGEWGQGQCYTIWGVGGLLPKPCRSGQWWAFIHRCPVRGTVNQSNGSGARQTCVWIPAPSILAEGP